MAGVPPISEIYNNVLWAINCSFLVLCLGLRSGSTLFPFLRLPPVELNNCVLGFLIVRDSQGPLQNR